jgi:hypothetical protein
MAAVDQNAVGELHNVLLAAGDSLGPGAAAEHVLSPFLESVTRSWPDDDAAVAVRHVSAALARSLQERAPAG